MESKDKFVEFDKWCPKCSNKDKKEEEEPCATCLESPVNTNSHKPVCYEE